MVKVINATPDVSVVKRTVCRHCGATLEYTPNDVETKRSVDYTGYVEFDKFIGCPNCHKDVYV